MSGAGSPGVQLLPHRGHSDRPHAIHTSSRSDLFHGGAFHRQVQRAGLSQETRTHSSVGEEVRHDAGNLT